MPNVLWTLSDTRSSIPRAYLSTLPLAPAGVAVLRDIRATLSNIMTVEASGMKYWPSHQTLATHPRPVLSIALSPDNTHIASTSSDAIRIWDFVSVTLVLEDLKAHSGLIISVAFSPDGSSPGPSIGL